ncbi:hypothetical protein PM03_09205 [Thalassobacter stenotrophicus]|uniref:hypothetical protein n=1 Tax=Thalassobacter stenotrophicus TaxID=266809 RepID=UPI00051FEFAF|nr:hypothetical protein [Thalassobacter stenotrophicus]KGK79651.1 hypothetical protein PM03_09205 [Thalassobacter stenotrophicus]
MMTVENFVNMLRKADALTYLNDFLQQNDDLLEIAFPDENEFYEIDDNAEDSEIVKTIQNILHKSGKSFIDQNLATEMMEIQELYCTCGEIFHRKLLEFGADIDMGGQMTQIFIPLLYERFDRIFNVTN